MQKTIYPPMTASPKIATTPHHRRFRAVGRGEGCKVFMRECLELNGRQRREISDHIKRVVSSMFLYPSTFLQSRTDTGHGIFRPFA
jgi:hypothetical protein